VIWPQPYQTIDRLIRDYYETYIINQFSKDSQTIQPKHRRD